MTTRHLLGPKHRPFTPQERREREQGDRREAACEAVRQRKALERSAEFRRAWSNPEDPKHAEASARWDALIQIETAHPSYVRAGGFAVALGVSAAVEREARMGGPIGSAPLDAHERGVELRELDLIERALNVKPT